MSLMLLISMALAHFEMVKPTPRRVGSMNDQKIAPCAGGVQPANRAPFVVKNNSIQLAFYWDGDNDIYFGFGENPRKFPYKIGTLKNAKMGETYTVPLDFSQVPLTDGQVGTIQAVCHQPDFDIYQCADVTLQAPTQTLSTTVSTPTSVLKKLADSLTEHISIPGGCNVQTEHMPRNSTSKNLAALWLRAAFHDVGKYEPGKSVAGLLPDFLDMKENSGIGPSIATKFVPKRLFNFSRADIIALGGQVVVSHCGGPSFEFSPGRVDAPKTPFESLQPLPDDDVDSFDVIKTKLKRIGLDPVDIVALVSGSHSMGGVHKEISPSATNETFAPFDDTPGIFDNDIFKKSLKQDCRLKVDCAIANDVELRPIVEKFANNQQEFYRQYAISFKKLVSIGHDLKDYAHLDVQVHTNLTAEGGFPNK